jgi:alkanesulfonate monooxygenase SsuD/methylene tetrahydromethanopterin reductase-like flavin-dependent oxidoreductase (luciferase family)
MTFRHPALLVRQAAALDDLSGGRMILGMGAGWQEREHHLFGFDLSDAPTRAARLEEGLEVVTRLLQSDEPITYQGRFFHLRGATLLPRPQRPRGPRILIGGNGPRRTLPLVARYADMWNAIGLGPEQFRERSAALDDLLRAAGRQPQDVRRSIMVGVRFARDAAELDQRLRWRHDDPKWAGASLDAVAQGLFTAGDGLVGTPDMLIRQIQAYAQSGVEELMLQWLDLDDADGLRALATSVLPHV